MDDHTFDAARRELGQTITETKRELEALQRHFALLANTRAALGNTLSRVGETLTADAQQAGGAARDALVRSQLPKLGVLIGELKEMERGEEEPAQADVRCFRLARELELVLETLQKAADAASAANAEQQPPGRRVWLVGSTVLLIVLGLSSLIAGFVRSHDRIPVSIFDLSRLLTAQSSYLIGGLVSLAIAAGLCSQKRDGVEAYRTATSSAIVHGGSTLFAALTLIGGAKAVEKFTLADGPQVLFVGSGTVHHYLFGSTYGGVGIDIGVALGEHGIRFWSLEAGTGDGLAVATGAYDHRSGGVFEQNVDPDPSSASRSPTSTRPTKSRILGSPLAAIGSGDMNSSRAALRRRNHGGPGAARGCSCATCRLSDPEHQGTPRLARVAD